MERAIIVHSGANLPILQTLINENIRPISNILNSLEGERDFPCRLQAIRRLLAKAETVLNIAEPRQGKFDGNDHRWETQWAAHTSSCREYVESLAEAEETNKKSQLYAQIETRPSSAYNKFLDMMRYVIDFARIETTAECEELRGEVGRLEDEAREGHGYGKRTYKGSSKHFENVGLGTQNNNTGSGNFFSGTVENPTFAQGPQGR